MPDARGRRGRGRAIDVGVAAALAAIYLVLSAVLLPMGDVARALGLGVVVFAGVATLALRFGRGVTGWGVFAVGFLAGVVLWVPTFPATGGRSSAAVALGLLGMQAAMLIWASVSGRIAACGRRTALRTWPILLCL